MSELIGNALGQLLGELFGESLERLLDRRALERELGAAVRRAEERFAREYREHDAELAAALASQTRFADLPSVRAALRAIVTRPFHDPAAPAAALQRSFADVLPERTDRERVDAAVRAFLGYLGQEALYIPQLQQLYALAFQKSSAESGRAIAASTAALLQGIGELRADLRQLPLAPGTPALQAPPGGAAAAERPHPWHNLPQRSYARFVGRQAELEQLGRLLLPHPRSRHFVITLDGIGGVGKSALAIELAYRYRSGYAALPEDQRFDAIVWVSAKRTLLTASGVQQRQQTFDTLEDLYREIATVLEQPAILQADPAQRRSRVERVLGAQRVLLIVDNLETVDDEELLSFLRELPDPTKAIVTTRHRIDIAYTIRLSGMPEPDAQALMLVEAARKGVALATAAEVAERVEEMPAGSAPSSAVLGELYRKTGGLPLAIVWSIGLMSLGHSVESVLRRLGSGHSDIARFCFAESVARIRERDAYRLLLALALFERSVSRQMLGEVAGLGDDVIGRDDGLAELLQLSLVEKTGDRFKLLPLTQSYALEELTARPELERELRERWVASLTELARPYLAPHWQQPGRRRLSRDGVHLVALSSWAQQAARPDVLLQIVPGLFSYYDLTGQWGDLLALGQIGLEMARLTGDLASARFILNMSAWVASQQGRHDAAEQMNGEAIALANQIGDPAWQCEILIDASQLLRRRLLFEQALERCRQALGLLPALHEPHRPYVQADIDVELGKIARDRGDWETALQHFQAARAVFRLDIENPVFNVERAWGAYGQLAFVAHQLGDLDSAAQMYHESLEELRETGSRGYVTTLLVRFASLEQRRGNRAAALEHAREALEWSRRLGMAQEHAQADALLAQLAQPD